MANPINQQDLSPEQQFIEQWYESGGIHRSVHRQLLIYERGAAMAGHLVPPGTYQSLLRVNGGDNVGEYMRANAAPADFPVRLRHQWMTLGGQQRGPDYMEAPTVLQALKDGHGRLNPADQVANRYAWYLSFESEGNPLIKHSVLRAVAEAEQAQSASPGYRPGMFIDSILESAQQLREQLRQQFKRDNKEEWADEQQAQLEPRVLFDNVLNSPHAPAGIQPATWAALQLQSVNEAPDISWPPEYAKIPVEIKKEQNRGQDTAESSSAAPASLPALTTDMATQFAAMTLAEFFGSDQPDLPRLSPEVQASPPERLPKTAADIAAMTPAEIAVMDQEDLPLVEVAEFEAFTKAQQVEYLYKRIGATRRRDTLAMLREIERRNRLPTESLLEWVQSYRAVVLANERPDGAPDAVTPEIWAAMRDRLRALPPGSRRRIDVGTLISMTTDEERAAVDQILRPLEQENGLPEGILLRRLYSYDIFWNQQPPHNAPAAITANRWNELRGLVASFAVPAPGVAQLTLRDTPSALNEVQRDELNHILARPDLPFNRAVVGSMIEIAAESAPDADPLRILKWSVAEWDSHAIHRRYGIAEAGNVLAMSEDQIRSRHDHDPALATYLKQLKTLQALSPPTMIIPPSPVGGVAQSTPHETPPLLNDAQRSEMDRILARPDLPFNIAVVGTMVSIAAESNPDADPLRILRWSLAEWDAVAELREASLWPDAGNVLTKTEAQIASREGHDPALLAHLAQLKKLQASSPTTTPTPLPPAGERRPAHDRKPTVEEIYKSSVQEFQYETVRKYARIRSMPTTGSDKRNIINGFISAYNSHTNGSLGLPKPPQSTFTPSREDLLRMMRLVEAATVGDTRTINQIVSPILNGALREVEAITAFTSQNEDMAMQGQFTTTLSPSTTYSGMVAYLRNEGHQWDSEDTYLANKSRTWKTFLTKEHDSKISEVAKMFSDIEKGYGDFPFNPANPDEAQQEREFVHALKAYIHYFEPTPRKNQSPREWAEEVRKWKDLQNKTSIDGYEGAFDRVGNQFGLYAHGELNSAQRLNVARALMSGEYRKGRLTFSESAVTQRREAKEAVPKMREEIDEAANTLRQHSNAPRILLPGKSSPHHNVLNVPPAAAAQMQKMIVILASNMMKAVQTMQQEFQIQKGEDGRDANQDYRHAPVYVQARVPTKHVSSPSNSIWLLHNFVQQAFSGDNQFSSVSAQLQDMLDKKIYSHAGSGFKVVGGLTSHNRGFRKVDNQQEELTGKMLADCHILLEAVQRLRENSATDQAAGWDNVLKPYVEKMNRTVVTELFDQRVHQSSEHLDQSDLDAVDQRFPETRPRLSVLVQPVAAPNTRVKGQAFRMTTDGSVLIEPDLHSHDDRIVHVVPKTLAAITLKPEVMNQLKNNRDERNKDPSVPAKVIDVQFTLKPTLATRMMEKVKQASGKFRR